MTTLQQALHIFRKDVRALRFEIAGVVLLTLLFMLTGVQTWESIQEDGYIRGNGSPLMVLLPITWCLLIARAIQSEALPGDRHFWLTRPYSRTGLMLAKLLLIPACVNAPLLIAQLWIILRSGVPLPVGALLWNQVLLAAVVLLPAAAIAGLTRNLAQFLPAAVLFAGFVVLLFEEGPRIRYPEWVGVSVGVFLGAVIASGALALQYWRRRTLRHAITFAVLSFVTIVIVLAFPRSAAYAVQSTVIGSTGKEASLAIAPAGAPVESANHNRYSQRVEFPIAVSGANPDDIVIMTRGVTLRTLAGVTRRYSTMTQIGPRPSIAIRMDRDFFEAAKDAPVRIRIDYRVMQFGNHRTANVAADGTPAELPIGQCGTVAGFDQRFFACRSAFRSSSVALGHRFTFDQPEARYSPLMLSIHPLHSFRHYEPTLLPNPAPMQPEPEIGITIREPVSLSAGTLEVADIRLAGYAVPDPAWRIQQVQ